MAYSVDLRERMLANLDEETMRRTAKRFRMSLSSVYRIKRHYQETGQLQAKKSRGRLPAIDAQGEAWLKEKVAEESDLTLARLCEKYEQDRGRKVSKSAMDRALKRMKLTLKKRRSTTRNEKVSRSKRSVRNIARRSPSLTQAISSS
jgi:transposase